MIESQPQAVKARDRADVGGPRRPPEKATGGDAEIVTLVGVAAIVFPLIYFVADLVEVAQGNFSTGRLVLAFIGESAIPLFVVGLYAVQRPRIGRLGYGAFAYAYAFVFFTSTVVYALAAGSKDWTAVTDIFGGWFTVFGAIMVVGGIAFGLAVIRASMLPRWTGICLIVGVVLVATTAGASNAVRTVAAALPDAAFVGMGVALLRARWPITSGQRGRVGFARSHHRRALTG